MSIVTRMRALTIALGLVVATGAATKAHASVIYYLTTGQTGAQTQIDAFHTTSWSFTATSNWVLGGGNFVMKDGSSTSTDIMLSVYQGTSSAGTLITSIDYTTAAFCTAQAGGNCQSFGATPFTFSSPINIILGDSYYIALTSTAPDAQSQAYFIKGLGSSSIVDANNNPLPNQTLTTTDAPEPATLALLGSGMLGLRLLRRRR